MLDLIFIAYLLLCGILLGIRHKRDKREWLLRFALAASLPVIGFLLPLFWRKRWQERNASRATARIAELDAALTIDNLGRHTGVYRKPDAEKERNVVPLEEALLVNDLTNRRRIMIDLLKQDSLEYLEVLRLAVGNEDTETSHYAVSAIMEIKRKLTLAMQELSVKYEENKQDAHLLASYADVLKSYMRSGFLDDRTMLKHKHTYTEVLGRLIAADPDTAGAYKDKLETELDLGRYSDAEQTALQFLERYPRSEDAYLGLMNVYYTLRSIDRLKQTLEQLKQSSIRLSSGALTAVRFWSEGGPHEAET
ncbi:tetratricopeptide repeat protein [Paenibacillus arenilitoris]|uniref:Tetratricopeptide repeat protein n=1 Tax=Paenibacillus arenilitoris TaxID=2772299 RepID=A0A927H5H0_9BACL|nr:hypothetical protein [Paenibacillus arenilitoris]MBD2867544.1 hypothetical protein [Paenibacillus arenilitoris]